MVQFIMKSSKVQRVEISYKTIIFTVFFLLLLVLLWRLKSILFLIFVCYVFMEGINPAVSWLEKKKISRSLAIILIYIFIFLFLSACIAGIVPPLVEQTSNLIKNLPEMVNRINFMGLDGQSLSSQMKLLEGLPSNIGNIAIGFFSNLFSLFILFVITFYLLMERNNFDHYLKKLFGRKSDRAVDFVNQMQTRLGSWMSAQLTLMLIIGILSYVGYLIIGVNYALPLAIMAGILEIVPNIGPTIASILAGFLGFTVSPLTGILAIAWGIVIQQLENNLVVPKIMKKAVGIHPLMTIVIIATGSKIGGIVGALMAVPLYLVFESIYISFFKENTPKK